MIQRLRIKFTITALLSVTVVLFVTLGVINGMNYRRILQASDEILDILAVNHGTFPPFPLPGRDDPGGALHGRPEMSPETPYEVRYFTVYFNTQSGEANVDTRRIAAVDATQAEELGKTAAQKKADRGFTGIYRFAKTEVGNDLLIIFLDCDGMLSHFHGFLTISVVTSLIGILLVFLLLAVQSGRVVRPFAESYEKQKRFITDAGHEIRTPLTIIDADAEILEMETGENEWVTDIQKQVQRLRGLTDDLIYLAKMEEKDKKMEKLPFPISETAADTLQSFQALARLQNRQLRWEIEPLLSCTGDMQSIRRLFGILLDNAVKYSDEGGKITFSLCRRGRNIQIVVCNTTKELVTAEQISHLFERFYRTDGSRNSQTGGYGIGLSIAKAIVRAHGGRISASTTDSHSLSIQILLPGR